MHKHFSEEVFLRKQSQALYYRLIIIIIYFQEGEKKVRPEFLLLSNEFCSQINVLVIL